MRTFSYIRGKCFHFGYTKLVKPLFFRLPPERIHIRMIRFGHRLGRSGFGRRLTAACFSYQHPALKQTLAGIDFRNPIGLAAGFDKQAELLNLLGPLGFGFAEIGSITAWPYAGNPEPRLWRLPRVKSLIVNYGLSGPGASVMVKRLMASRATIPLGISIARSNVPETSSVTAGVNDYVQGFNQLKDSGQYITLNISCPNTCGGEPFHRPQQLRQLLQALPLSQTEQPVFLKISPDLTDVTVEAIVELALQHNLAGIIAGNLTKDRTVVAGQPNLPPGGLSGKPTWIKSNHLIAKLYRLSGGKLIIIGCGGVFSAEDAYTKIRLGAALIQLVTGLIYEGPQLIGQINEGLVALLKRDGFTNISQAIGADTVV